jgi:hypothetical protein
MLESPLDGVAKYCMLWKSFGHATGDTSLISAFLASLSYKTASGTVSFAFHVVCLAQRKVNSYFRLILFTTITYPLELFFIYIIIRKNFLVVTKSQYITLPFHKYEYRFFTASCGRPKFAGCYNTQDY